uniref:Secreted protein n=1 Tax=Triticum urartu TaxID=4572 RepID=A0A8R7UXM0_TRIUA
MPRWACAAAAITQVPTVALFVHTQVPADATSDLSLMAPLPHPRLARSMWVNVPSLPFVRSKAPNPCFLCFR